MPGLRGRVGGGERPAGVTGYARDADDRAVAAPDHVGQHRADGADEAEQVDVDLALGRGGVVLGDVERLPLAGAVDQRVDLAPAGAQVARRLHHGEAIRHIEGEHGRFGADGAGAFGDRFERLGVAAAEGEARAGASEFRKRARRRCRCSRRSARCGFPTVPRRSPPGSARGSADEGGRDRRGRERTHGRLPAQPRARGRAVRAERASGRPRQHRDRTRHRR